MDLELFIADYSVLPAHTVCTLCDNCSESEYMVTFCCRDIISVKLATNVFLIATWRKYVQEDSCDIISEILSYLESEDFNNTRCVCKSWYYASNDPMIIRGHTITPIEKNVHEISKSNRKFGTLNLKKLTFDKPDRHYFELFEQICPSILAIDINSPNLKINHLLKILEYSPCLRHLTFDECRQLSSLPALFPLGFNCDAKNRIISNLSHIKYICVVKFKNISLIANLSRYTTNLEMFTWGNEFVEEDGDADNPYAQFCTIFHNDNIGGLTSLTLQFNYADDFVTSFVQIKNLNLKSLCLMPKWNGRGADFNKTLFHKLILKLQSLETLTILGLTSDLLTIICQYLVNLKRFFCMLDAVESISQLGNLQKLEDLGCRFPQNDANIIDIDKFFTSKFPNLRKFEFCENLTQTHLTLLCENHPNLIELTLTNLLTCNLEIIFRHLTKLRYLKINFFNIGKLHKNEKSNMEYEYKLSRLQNLRYLYLDEPLNGIREDDFRQLRKLRSTNLPKLFERQHRRENAN